MYCVKIYQKHIFIVSYCILPFRLVASYFYCARLNNGHVVKINDTYKIFTSFDILISLFLHKSVMLKNVRGFFLLSTLYTVDRLAFHRTHGNTETEWINNHAHTHTRT